MLIDVCHSTSPDTVNIDNSVKWKSTLNRAKICFPCNGYSRVEWSRMCVCVCLSAMIWWNNIDIESTTMTHGFYDFTQLKWRITISFHFILCVAGVWCVCAGELQSVNHVAWVSVCVCVDSVRPFWLQYSFHQNFPITFAWAHVLPAI